MGNQQTRALEIRQSRVYCAQYPYSDYENHLRTDIHSLAQTYNFSGRGICRSIPHISKSLKLDHVQKHEHMAEFSLVDTDELYFPKAYPGDEIVFVVYCEVVKEPKQRPSKPKSKSNKTKKAKKAKCNLILLQYEVANQGLFHVDIQRHGEPADFTISYDRFVQFCGQRSLTYQRCRNTIYASEVFEHFFKMKKVRWIFQRVRGSGAVETADLEPISNVGVKERLSIKAFPKNLKCTLWDRVVVTGTIESQGGSWNAHGIIVEKVEVEHHMNPDNKPPQPIRPAVPISPAGPIPPARPVASLTSFPPYNPFSGGPRPPNLYNNSPNELTNPFAKIPQPASNPHVLPTGALPPADLTRIQKSDPSLSVDMLKEDDELKETIQIGECVVCMDDIPTHAFIPCGHRCVCEDCSETVRSMGKCPICQVPTTTCIRIFI